MCYLLRQQPLLSLPRTQYHGGAGCNQAQRLHLHRLQWDVTEVKQLKFIFICERIRLILCFHFYGGILIKFLPPTIAQVLVGVWHIIQSVLASSITARCKYVLSLMIYIIILIAGPIYVGFDVLLTCTRMFMHAWCSQGTFRACQRRWTVRCFE